MQYQDWSGLPTTDRTRWKSPEPFSQPAQYKTEPRSPSLAPVDVPPVGVRPGNNQAGGALFERTNLRALSLQQPLSPHRGETFIFSFLSFIFILCRVENHEVPDSGLERFRTSSLQGFLDTCRAAWMFQAVSISASGTCNCGDEGLRIQHFGPPRTFWSQGSEMRNSPSVDQRPVTISKGPCSTGFKSRFLRLTL